ncbi:MAG: PDZ domain-containing protein, partial [Candidatus Aminicenantales bacterium]
EQLIAKGEIERGYMGLYLQDIDEDLAKALKLKKAEGVLVADVVADGPAAKAGIKRGDIIIEINGQKVENGTQLKNVIAMTPPHTRVEIGLLRNGHRMKVEVTLGERPGERGRQQAEEKQQQEKVSRKLGLIIQTLTPDIAQQLGYDNDRGVIVAAVEPGSPADDAGLQRGDLIKEVNRVRVESVSDFEREAKKLKSGDVAALLIRRGQSTFFVAIKVK